MRTKANKSVAILFLGIGLSCSTSLAGVVLDIYPAASFSTEESKNFARERLGCDQCGEVTHHSRIGRVQYLIDRDEGIFLRRSEVLGAHLMEGDDGSFLFLKIEGSVSKMIENSRLGPLGSAAVVHRGEVLDVVPLRTHRGLFLFARVANQTEATELLHDLGLGDVPIVPFE